MQLQLQKIQSDWPRNNVIQDKPITHDGKVVRYGRFDNKFERGHKALTVANLLIVNVCFKFVYNFFMCVVNK